MTDRRRNLFILLRVAGLLAASLYVITSKETKLGLDLRGGVELIYEASPTPQQPVVDQAALDRAIDVMRDRVDALGVSEPEIQRSGNNQISVGLPDVENAEEAEEQVIGRPAREVLGLQFGDGTDAVGTVLEWGVRQLDKPVQVNAEGDLPAKAKADLFPAYDDDGGMLLVLTPTS